MGQMIRFPQLAERIVTRLRDLNYWNPRRRRPDIRRFCVERGYLPQLVYDWVNKGSTPTWENVSRLARDLDLPIEFLLLGHKCPDGQAKKKRPNGRRPLAGLLLALTMAGVLPHDGTPAVAAPVSRSAPSRRKCAWLHKLWAGLVSRTPQPIGLRYTALAA